MDRRPRRPSQPPPARQPISPAARIAALTRIAEALGTVERGAKDLGYVMLAYLIGMARMEAERLRDGVSKGLDD